jgi:hypothetical protein
MCRYNNHRNITGGYTTLLLVTIIGFSFLVSIGVISREVRRAQDRSLASQQHLEAISLAETCRQEVLVRLFRDAAYRGNEDINLDGHLCTVGQLVVDAGAETVSFPVSATVGNYIRQTQFENQSLLD